MRRPGRLAGTSLLATLAVLLIALSVPTTQAGAQTTTAAASEAAVFGAPTGGTHSFGLECGVPAEQTCEMTSTVQALTAAHQSPGGPTAPTAGVITSWSMSHGPVMLGGGSATASLMTVALRVVRGQGGAGIGVGASPPVNLPQAAGTYSFPVRITVQPGDRIGYDLRFMPGDITLYGGIGGTTGDVIGISSPLWPNGATPAAYQSSDAPPIEADVYLPMNATLEPDADGDGFGDISQDQCPSNAATQGMCPVIDIAAPATSITDKPPNKSEKRKAKLRFASSEEGSTFECKLTGPGLDRPTKRFRPCDSPRVYKHLDAGKYEFSVRAIDRAGNVDPSPAGATFKVVAAEA